MTPRAADAVPVRAVIVDDQPLVRRAARMVLELADGFEVVGEAESGEASLDLILDLDADLVLMDIDLPGINGLEATRRITAASSRKRVILILSTYEEDDYAARAVAAGAAAFIPKSAFGIDTLTEAWTSATSSS